MMRAQKSNVYTSAGKFLTKFRRHMLGKIRWNPSPQEVGFLLFVYHHYSGWWQLKYFWNFHPGSWGR